MDTLTTIVNSVCTLLGILGAGTSVLFYTQNKRMHQAEAKTKEVEAEAHQSLEWKKLFDQSDADRRDLDKKIDALYAERQQLLHTIIERDKTISCKDILIERYKFDRCIVNDCTKRNPPRKYNENKTDTQP